MDKDLKEESEKIKVIVEEEKEDDFKESSSEVELGEKKAEVSDPEKESDSIQISEELKKVVNRMEYQARQFERKTRELDERLSKLAKTSSNDKVVEESDLDDLDKIAEKDWKKAVSIVAERVLTEREEKRKSEEHKAGIAQELEESKDRVRAKYPEIDDENSPKARMFMEVLSEHPALLKNPMGPELAMYRMEERLRQKPVDRESERRARIVASAIPDGRKDLNSNKYVMTREQKEYCDHHGLNYEQYARTAKRLEGGEPLEV